jgi:AcrR family transcriptional regulator
VRSTQDLTGAALIRDAAMRLFAQQGTAAVTIRAIAREAGVSPSLVIHHYGSKESLKRAVDEHVVTFLKGVVDQFASVSADDLVTASTSTTLADRLGGDSVLPYVRRLLIDGGAAAEALFGSLYEMTLAMAARFEAAGLARPSSDDQVRAAVMLVNDLAVLLLRDQIGAVLGFDPLDGEGLARWSGVLMDIYVNGVLKVPSRPEGGAR